MSLYIDQCDLGKGLFAKRPFKVGDYITAIGGPIIDYETTRRLGAEEGYPLQIAINTYIDIEGVGRFLNHSCDPNAGIMLGSVLVAICTIRPGEEIRYDYSTTMASDPWIMECRCNSIGCRHVIGNYTDLPLAVRMRYEQLGIVPEYARTCLKELDKVLRPVISYP